MLSPSVFKAYDVRGVVPDELDEEGAYRLGRAYVAEFEPAVMAVGRDMRLSSPGLAEALARGAAEQGADVVDLGQIGTEMLYFAVGEYGYEGGIQVTASHNPRQYNGMKIVRRGALPVGGDTGLDKLKQGAVEGELPAVGAPGSITQRDVYAEFHDRVLQFIDPSALRPMRVVMDGANGMAGPMIEPLLDRLPIDAIPSNMNPDGTFPNHEPNPLLEENRQFIIDQVRSQGADLGIAWDGDADRCFFIDDTGEFVPGDLITALIARSMLEKHPGATIVYDLRASWAVRDTVEQAGGTALENRVGHAFIKARIRKEQAVFAGEVSGHYYFKDFYWCDTGIVPALVLLELISKSGKQLSELLAPYRERYFISGEINSTVSDVPLKLQELKERYRGEAKRVSHLDGISFEFEDWHFNVRPSNTEPLLRLNLEALSQDTMEAKRDEVLGLIRS
ncbi:MAG: phosphomannomutase [Gaiellales bacterium]|jgi:phosphomannomutase|nr:phosphomannomutase [Gaiellales bacterium]